MVGEVRKSSKVPVRVGRRVLIGTFVVKCAIDRIDLGTPVIKSILGIGSNLSIRRKFNRQLFAVIIELIGTPVTTPDPGPSRLLTFRCPNSRRLTHMLSVSLEHVIDRVLSRAPPNVVLESTLGPVVLPCIIRLTCELVSLICEVGLIPFRPTSLLNVQLITTIILVPLLCVR